MILEPWTVALLLIDAIAVALWPLCLRAVWRTRRAMDATARDEAASWLALLFVSMAVLRSLAAIGLFVAFDALAPRLVDRGVLCALGVFELHPTLATALLSAKGLVAVALFAWWMAVVLGGGGPSRRFELVQRVCATLVVAFVALDIALELAWLFLDKQAGLVTCCSAAAAAASASGVRVARPLGVPMEVAWTAWWIGRGASIAACAWVARACARPTALWVASLATFGAATAVLDFAMWRDGVAPRALGLEFHRCAFELWNGSPFLGVLALAVAAGHAAWIALACLGFAQREPAYRPLVGRVGAVTGLIFATEVVALALHLY